MARVVRRERSQSRWALIFAASLFLHVAVFGGLWLLRPPPAAPVAAPPPTRIQLKWLSADDVQTRPAAAKPKKTTSAASKGGQPPRASAPATAFKGDTGDRPTAVVVAPGDGFDGGVGMRGDRPLARGSVFTPGYGGVLGMPEALDGEPSHGSTLRNGPDERVDEGALAEYTGEVLSRQVGQQLREDAARAAASVGSAPPHFRRLESSLRDTFDTTPVDRTPGGDAAHIARAILTPGVSPEAARRVTDSALGRAVQNNIGGGPNIEDQRARESMLQMMGAVEGVKERLSAVRLRTVLELTTDSSGAIADVSIVERSGDPRFDESVLHLTRKTARALPDDDENRGLGASWWKTRWQYTWEPPRVRVKLLEAVRLPNGG